MKERLRSISTRPLMRSLIDYANRRGKSKSLIAEAAIGVFPITRRGRAPRSDVGAEARSVSPTVGAARARCRDRGRDPGALRSFLADATPALPEQTEAAARAKGAERYDGFVEALGRRLAKGPTLLREVSLDITAASEPNANAKPVNDTQNSNSRGAVRRSPVFLRWRATTFRFLLHTASIGPF